MGGELPPGHVPCPTCARPVDKLRAGAVAAFEGGVAYFCSPSCKASYQKPASTPSEAAASRQGEPPSALGRERPERDAPPATAPAPVPLPEPMRLQAEGPPPDRVVRAGSERASETGPEPEGGQRRAPTPTPAAAATAEPRPQGTAAVRAEPGPNEAVGATAEDEPREGAQPLSDAATETAEPGRPVAAARSVCAEDALQASADERARGGATSDQAAGLAGPARDHVARFLGAVLLTGVAALAPTVAEAAVARHVQVAAAILTVLWVAGAAMRTLVRDGWRAGLEEVLVLAGVFLTGIAAIEELRATGSSGAFVAAPVLALATWTGRWIEAGARARLFGRLLAAVSAEEAESLRVRSSLLWGDSRAEATAMRGWVGPPGARPALSTGKQGMSELLPRIAALRGDGSSPFGRAASRAATYVGFGAVPVAAALLLLSRLLAERPSLPVSFLLAAGVVLALSPRALRRGWVSPLLEAGGSAVGRGVLFRDGAALEATARASWVVFDARGTLTRPQPSVTSVAAVGTLDETTLLSLAGGAERAAAADTPIGAAVVCGAEERGVPLLEVRLARRHEGLGISATSPKGDLLVGNRQFLLGQGISIAEAEEKASEMEARAQTVLFLALGRRVQGVTGLDDEVCLGVDSLAEDLARIGVEAVLMTGDSQSKAEALGERLGFEHVRAGLSPEGWAEQVASLRETGHGVAMVARPPRHEDTLAAADVGITIAQSGLDVETAGVALTSREPCAAREAVSVARSALRTARRNIVLASASIMAGIGLALLPLGPLHPWAPWAMPTLIALLSAATVVVVSSGPALARRQ